MHDESLAALSPFTHLIYFRFTCLQRYTHTKYCAFLWECRTSGHGLCFSPCCVLKTDSISYKFWICFMLHLTIHLLKLLILWRVTGQLCIFGCHMAFTTLAIRWKTIHHSVPMSNCSQTAFFLGHAKATHPPAGPMEMCSCFHWLYYSSLDQKVWFCETKFGAMVLLPHFLKTPSYPGVGFGWM